MVWHDDLTLLDLNRRDRIRLLDALYNFLILGGIGSGKSSGPFQYIIRALLNLGAGILFLAVKADAADTYRRWIREAGREADLIEFGPGHPATYNFLDEIPRRHGGDPFLMVEEVLHVLLEAMTLLRRRDGGQSSKDDGFFQQAADKLLRAALVVLFVARGRLELDALAAFLSSIPRNPDEPLSERLFAVRQIREAREKLRAEGREDVIVAATRFLDRDWAGYAIETRESIRATAQVLIDQLTYEPLVSLFGAKTTVSPDDILAGKIVLVTPAIHDRQRVGQVSAAIWKAMAQRAVLARKFKNVSEVRPVVIAGDEAHELVTPGDVRFVSSSRSQRGVTVYSTQTVTSLMEALGPSATSTLLAGLRTRFVCRSDDPDTAKWIAESLADAPTSRPALGRLATEPLGVDLPLTVRALRQGGQDRVVEAIAVCGGDKFRVNDRRWSTVTFNQTPPSGVLGGLRQAWTTNDVRVMPRPRRRVSTPRKRP